MKIPLKHPAPNGKRFINILMGKEPQRTIPLVEYIIDDAVMRPIITDLLGRTWVPWGEERESQKAYLDNMVQLWYQMGYDHVRFELGLPFPERKLVTQDTARGANKDRAWADEHRGVIENREDFEHYAWPRVEDFDFFPLEYLSSHLPEGMGFVTSHGGGPFEHLSWIMSLEGLSYALYEDPELIGDITGKLGELMTGFYRQLLDLENLLAIFPGDDMGYRSSTMVNPRYLRQYILPWHKRFAGMTHERGLPYFLHSCGRIMEIMPDLIQDIGIDGKHSYEDAIMPAEEFQQTYGGQIAVLGGVDLNILSGGTPDQVRRRVRALMETCGARGRYAIGSGNSVPSYVPVENYLAMVDEARLFNETRL